MLCHPRPWLSGSQWFWFFLSHPLSLSEEKGDEVDGIDEVAKKKSKKEKDKEIKLEKALKGESGIACLLFPFSLILFLILGRIKGGVGVLLYKSL